MLLTVAYVLYTYSYAESHTHRTRIAHMSYTYRKLIANWSHTCRIRIAHLSHTYRTHRTHFWLSLRHGTMSSALFQVFRLNFVLQTCLINSLNSRDTYCTCYLMFKHMFSVHSKLKIYPCLEISLQSMDDRVMTVTFDFVLLRNEQNCYLGLYLTFNKGLRRLIMNYCERMQDRRWRVSTSDVYKQCCSDWYGCLAQPRCRIDYLDNL